MRCVIQRVSKASVKVEGKIKGEINKGLLVLLGIEHKDSDEEIKWMVRKLANLRIFNDNNGIMNLSVKAINGEILVISQFTLYGDINKGLRPSYHRAAKPDIAIPLYNNFIKAVELELGKSVPTGEFGAMMEVSLINDGPVTIIIDSSVR